MPELFGHEAGAFTGCTTLMRAPAGSKAANGGTLFLDEIGDLPMALQTKLLRVLQERQVVRLGSRRPIALDVRLVAATNINLARAVVAQHFRADLYYRLSVAGLELPALHERQADILLLAEHFIGVYCNRLGIRAGAVEERRCRRSAAATTAGPARRIRELENVIHYALIVCAGDEIHPADLKLVPLLHPRSDRRAGPAALPTRRECLRRLSPAVQRRRRGRRRSASCPRRLAAAPTPRRRSARAWRRVFDALLREGGDGLFDAVERALVHAAFESTRSATRCARPRCWA